MTKGIRYKKNYLTGVIFRINFSNILQLSGKNKEAAEKFQKEIFDKFPNVHFQFNNNINVQVDIQEGKSESKLEDGDLTWIFTDEQNTKQVELNSKSLILAYRKGAYEGFEEFLDDVSLILAALRWYMPFNLTFLGLRYINQIHEDVIDDSNIHEYVNESLLNNVIFELEDNEGFSQLFSRLDLLKDDYQLTFQYGFFNPNFPNVNDKNEFILDYDCVNNNINSLDEINSNLTNMHKLIEEKFKVSTTKQFKEFIDK